MSEITIKEQKRVKKLKELNEEIKKLYRAGKKERAVSLAEKVVELTKKSYSSDHPYVVSSLKNLSKLYKLQGSHDKSEEVYKRALLREKNGSYVRINENLISNKSNINFNIVTAINNRSKDIPILLILTFFIVGIATYYALIDPFIINAELANHWFEKGNALMVADKKEEALRAYNEATQNNPNEGNYWIKKTECLLILKRTEEALETFNKAQVAYDKAISNNPKEPQNWADKGRSLYLSEQYGRAINAYDEVTRLDPTNSNGWLQKANCFYGLEYYEEAAQNFDKVIKLLPENEKGWAGKALCSLKILNYEDSLKAYSKAIEINPNNRKHWLGKIYCLGKLHKYQELRKTLSDQKKVNRKSDKNRES